MAAGSLTSATLDASSGLVHHFQAQGLALGIVAPPAVERTSFEKDRGADPGPVVEGEFLYVENLPHLQSAVSTGPYVRHAITDRAHADGRDTRVIIIAQRQ